MLIRHLPRDSEVNRALHGEGAEWNVADYLLAAAVDHLAVANWMTATLNRDEDEEPLDYPDPVPRPGDAPPDGVQEAGNEADGSAPQEPPAPPPEDDPEAPGWTPAPVRGPSRAELARFFG
ncbi:hypothetical protein [Streptomyces boncukensis]|uniref:hypothetical protein n=1 Tax=Streptomyces boncukensis TaxID=2711219 RepID=UPI003B96D776